MSELRSDLAESLFRESALRHVLNRADVLQSTILVSGRVSDHVQVLDRAVGHLQPVLVFNVAAAAPRPVEHLIQQRHVFRVDSSTHQLESHGHTLVKLENAIKLF